VGAIALHKSRKPHGFSQDDRALLRLISANASTAVRLFRSRLERERSERLTTIGRLLSGVMHDMRTPLTVISGYVQLMAGATDATQRADHARLILKQFDLISAMQREVLEFARGERSILLRKVYLTKFFEDLEKQLIREIDGTGVELVVDLGDRGTARFDESKMTRVIHNLSRNAVEAMGSRGGKLTIRVARESGDLVVSVSDTGRGIPKDIEDKLFQSFVTYGKRGGTGLGLAIVKKIVDEHGGSISVHSSSKGATFTIRLPQDTAPPREAAHRTS
jgi:signal transduction histidine kinase